MAILRIGVRWLSKVRPLKFRIKASSFHTYVLKISAAD